MRRAVQRRKTVMYMWIALGAALWGCDPSETAHHDTIPQCDMCAPGTTCDPDTGTCVGCLDDDMCGGGRCHPVARTCVQCVDDDDCQRGLCDPGQNVCVGCYADTHCDGVCHPERRTCVDCLTDSDCGTGRCHLPTLTCVGPCQSDRHCDDGNPCTTDRCDGGRCDYTTRDGETCDDGLACTIHDRCQGRTCRGDPTDTCCPDEPRCPTGTRPVDADRDGCSEACECESGAVIPPDGVCPCPQTIVCHGGLVGSDLDGDGCADFCTQSCRDACDCQAQGLRAELDCAWACDGCGPRLECVAGTCQGTCGTDKATCECPEPPKCGPLETAFDKDGDGCNEACRCLHPAADGRCLCPFSVSCGVGAEPYDTDGDGCDDACRCVGSGAPPGPDGRCCPALVCSAREEGWDADGDGCDDVCCGALSCPPGAIATDTDADRCPDTCLCPNGGEAPPLGCGCHTLVWCEPGQTAVDRDHDGCPDDCVWSCRTACDCEADKVAVQSCCDGCRASSVCLAGFCASTCETVALECATPQSDVEAVCGCDGTTYANPCEAGRAKVDLAGYGECDALTCYGGDCAAKKTCELAAGVCQATDRSTHGVCVDMPTHCLAVISPVCGCDGVAYSNDCERRRAGVSLGAPGSCAIDTPR